MRVKFTINRAVLVPSRSALLLILPALAVSTLVVSLTSLGRDYLYARMVGRIVSSLRQRMFEHLQCLSMEFYARTEVGDVMFHFSKDINSVDEGTKQRRKCTFRCRRITNVNSLSETMESGLPRSIRNVTGIGLATCKKLQKATVYELTGVGD